MAQTALRVGQNMLGAIGLPLEAQTMSRSQHNVRHALRADARSIGGLSVLALLIVPIVIAFEWGFGNDFTNVFFISSAYESSSGIFAISRAMLAGFMVPFVLQLFGGLVASLGFGALEHTAVALRARVAERSESIGGIAYSRLKFFDQWWVSVALGTTAAVLLEQGRPDPAHATGQTTGIRHVVVVSALFMAVTTSLVSGLCAGLLELAGQFERLAPIVDDLVAVLTNPFAWIALFACIGAVRLASSWLRGSR